MDVQSTKLDLIHWLTELEDKEMLEQLATIKEGTDFWDILSVEDKEAIKEGLSQLYKSERFSHSELDKEIRSRFAF